MQRKSSMPHAKTSRSIASFKPSSTHPARGILEQSNLVSLFSIFSLWVLESNATKLRTTRVDNSESRTKARPNLSQSDWVYHQNGTIISAGIFDININAIGSHIASASLGHVVVCTRPKISRRRQGVSIQSECNRHSLISMTLV